MTIEISIFIAILSVFFSGLVAISGLNRNSKKDIKNDTTQLTTVIVKLENIGSDIKDLKNDMRLMKDDLREHGEKIVRMEQQVKVLNNAVFGKTEKGGK